MRNIYLLALGLIFCYAANGQYTLTPGDVTFDDFTVLGSVWLSGLGDTDWNPVCNISIPADAFIDTRDLAVFVEHWLETGCL